MIFDDNFDDNFDEDCQLPSSSSIQRLSLFRKPAYTSSPKSAVPQSRIEEKSPKTPNTENTSQFLKPFRTPSKFVRSHNESPTTHLGRRKFPGPAGLLPDKRPRSFQDSSLLLACTEADKSKDGDETSLLCSQTTSAFFDEPPYKKLRIDLDLDRPDSSLKNLTINWVKKKNWKGKKIPLLALVLESIDCSHVDPVLKLRDPTGFLNGVISAELWKEMGSQLKVGAALALKDVGIIKNVSCLNITESNIVAVYTPHEDGGANVTSHQTVDSQDFVRQVEEWQAKAAQLLHDTSTRLRSVQHSSNGLSSPNFLGQNVTSAAKSRPPHPSDCPSPACFDLFDDDFDISDSWSSGVVGKSPEVAKSESSVNVNSNTSISLTQDEAAMVNDVMADLEFDDEF